jgi:hypothetical protein
MNEEYRGIEISIKDLAKKHEVSTNDAMLAYNFFWKEVKRAKTTFVHPYIYCKGLGTFELIYSRIPYVFDRLDKITTNELLDDSAKNQAIETIENVKQCKLIMDEQYNVRKQARASRKHIKDIPGDGTDLPG